MHDGYGYTSGYNGTCGPNILLTTERSGCIYECSSDDVFTIEIDKVRNIQLYEEKIYFYIIITYQNGRIYNPRYTYKSLRDADFKNLYNLVNDTQKQIKNEIKKGDFNMIDSFKKYLKQHEETIITICMIIIIDQVVFNGAFKDKLKQIVDSMINKVNKSLGVEKIEEK